ncbi:hypothetical protein HPB52_012636 [Rhipicephalus sanguineus]|uniref:Uncharacterized protein n=1 Tax=Rhipicephalus sanguineus TaxID=34632 RepID=A0A9D4T048_RHISA|nr:hypothetical protein HPB52_012636 [Rhipicephalus sanguineus]
MLAGAAWAGPAFPTKCTATEDLCLGLVYTGVNGFRCGQAFRPASTLKPRRFCETFFVCKRPEPTNNITILASLPGYSSTQEGMMEFERLYAIGKDLGMTGAELKRWVDAEIARERDQRAQNREDAKAQAEQDRLRLEAEERVLKLKIELQEKTGSTQGASTDASAGQALARAAPDIFSPHKLIPPFNEERDDLDAYLKRFERVATSQDWPRTKWALSLSLCLTGEALTVIGRLDSNAATDYDQLKATLLQRFRYTAEGYREKFRNARPEDNETAMQYVGRISGYFDHWIEMSQTYKSFDSLRDAMIDGGDGYVVLQSGETIPIVNTTLMPPAPGCDVAKLPVRRGFLESQPVSVLRDTGCNTVVVRHSLIPREKMTGTTSPVFLLDRTIRYLPEAIVFLDTPFFTGLARVKCMRDPLYDVVLGNIEGARPPNDPTNRRRAFVPTHAWIVGDSIAARSTCHVRHLEDVVVFFCKHAFHSNCLPSLPMCSLCSADKQAQSLGA